MNEWLGGGNAIEVGEIGSKEGGFSSRSWPREGLIKGELEEIEK